MPALGRWRRPARPNPGRKWQKETLESDWVGRRWPKETLESDWVGRKWRKETLESVWVGQKWQKETLESVWVGRKWPKETLESVQAASGGRGLGLPPESRVGTYGFRQRKLVTLATGGGVPPLRHTPTTAPPVQTLAAWLGWAQ